MFSALMLATFMAQATPVDTCFGWFNRCSGCSGCYGCSCFGGSCSGCWGSRCWGRCSGCSGCNGCGGGGWSCHGSWGSSCHGRGSYSCHGCYGCYGCTGCSGAYAAPTMTAPATTHYYQPVSAPVAQPTVTTDSAKLVVKLPADAKLYVDDAQTTTANKEVRHFRTPALTLGQEYTYTLRAEVVRDGKVVTDTKTVLVRAGSTVEMSFDLPKTELAAK